MKVYSQLLFAFTIHFVSCDVDENHQLYRDVSIAFNERISSMTISSQCKPDQNAPFIFRDEFDKVRSGYKKWMTIYNINESGLDNIASLYKDRQYTGLMSIPKKHMESQWSVNPPIPGSSYANYTVKDNHELLMGYNASFDPRKIALFRNVWVDAKGLIVEPTKCQAIRNGACNPAMVPFISKSARPTDKPYKLVISLATSWKGTWHWPMENIIALAHIHPKLLDQANIHLPESTNYLKSWLSVLGIPNHRMIFGTVPCQVLLTPEMRCGKPHLSTMLWMRKTLLSLANVLPAGVPTAIPTATPTSTFISDAPTRSPSRQPTFMPTYTGTANLSDYVLEVPTVPPTMHATRHLNILLIERYQKRPVTNQQLVTGAVQTFARTNGMSLIHHSDRALSSILNQVKKFARADIVVAPHGAGLMFINFLPGPACVIEVTANRSPYCYGHLSYLYNFSHIIEYLDGDKMNIDLLRGALRRCRDILLNMNETEVVEQRAFLRNITKLATTRAATTGGTSLTEYHRYIQKQLNEQNKTTELPLV